MRTIFLSYRDSLPADKARAEKLATILRANGLTPVLEPDKKRPSEDFASSLYDQLCRSEAVVSILSSEAIKSRYIYFEALTAKLQSKWYPVIFDDVSLPEELMGTSRLRLTDAQIEQPLDHDVRNLVRSIKGRAAGARIYRGFTRTQENQRAASRSVSLALTFSLLAGMVTLLANLGNVRSDVCKNTHFKSQCAAAGWPSSDHTSND